MEHVVGQVSLMGLPCIDKNKKKEESKEQTYRCKIRKTNLIGSDPKTAPLQFSAAIALSAYMGRNLIIKTYSADNSVQLIQDNTK